MPIVPWTWGEQCPHLLISQYPSPCKASLVGYKNTSSDRNSSLTWRCRFINCFLDCTAVNANYLDDYKENAAGIYLPLSESDSLMGSVRRSRDVKAATATINTQPCLA